MNRNSKGQFARQSGKIIVWLLVLVIICLGSFAFYQFTHPVILPPIVKDISGEQYAKKIDELEKSVVANIRACESNGHKESDGLIVFDSNKVASIGTLQFQVKTVQYYYKSLYKQEITGKEAILIALDDKKAGELAQDILFKTKDGWKNWYNCSNKMSLEAQISAIKKIK